MSSVVAAPGLQSTGSIAVAHRLICSEVCGIFLGQGSKSCLLHWQENSLALSHQGSPKHVFWGPRISYLKHGHVQKSRSYGWWLKGPKAYTLQKRREGEIETRETSRDDWGAACLIEEGEDLLHPISSSFFSSGGTTGTDGEKLQGNRLRLNQLFPSRRGTS